MKSFISKSVLFTIALLLLVAGCKTADKTDSPTPYEAQNLGLGAADVRTDTAIYSVIMNYECQLSIWPTRQMDDPPLGWDDYGYQGPKSEVLAFVNRVFVLTRPVTITPNTTDLNIMVDDKYQINLKNHSDATPAGWQDYGFRGDYVSCSNHIINIFKNNSYRIIRQGTLYAIQPGSQAITENWVDTGYRGTVTACRYNLYLQGVSSYTVTYER